MTILYQFIIVFQIIACLCFCGVVLVGWSIFLHKAQAYGGLKKLKGKHVMITGGSSGIGLSLAKLAVHHGANVSILARDQKKLDEAVGNLIDELKGSQRIEAFSIDVSSGPDKIASVVAEAEKTLGPVYFLVNCAGYCYSEVLEKIPAEHISRMMSVNYLGAAYFTRAVVPGMKAAKEGIVTFVSSQAGILGLYGFTGYSASKFALRGFAESLRMELKPYNVTVTFSMPPDTDTPGLVAENETKPAATKEISAGAGLSSPDDVAKKILNDSVGGTFFSCHGLEGQLLGILCAGMTPAGSFMELIGQSSCIGIIRLATAFFRKRFDSIIEKSIASEEASGKPKATKKEE